MPTSQATHDITNADAVAHLRRAIDSFNHWNLDLMDHLDAALAADPAMPFAHALMGLALAGGRNVRFDPVVSHALSAAQAGAADVSPRERLYIQALDHAAAGRLLDAVAVYETTWPPTRPTSWPTA